MEARATQVPDDPQHPEVASLNLSEYQDLVLGEDVDSLDVKDPIGSGATNEEIVEEIGEACDSESLQENE